MDFESFKFFCIRVVRHSRNMPSNNKQYFFMFLIGVSASVRVFRSPKSDLKSRKNNTVIQDNLASYLVYGTEGIIRV
jgi:hypothetical protein